MFFLFFSLGEGVCNLLSTFWFWDLNKSHPCSWFFPITYIVKEWYICDTFYQFLAYCEYEHPCVPPLPSPIKSTFPPNLPLSLFSVFLMRITCYMRQIHFLKHFSQILLCHCVKYHHNLTFLLSFQNSFLPPLISSSCSPQCISLTVGRVFFPQILCHSPA